MITATLFHLCRGSLTGRSRDLYTFLMGPESAGKDEFWLRKLPPETPTIDHYWLRYLRDEDKWLADYQLEAVPDIPTLVDKFKQDIQGLVVYDEKVPATSNVASTVAGADNLSACGTTASRTRYSNG